MDVRLLSIDKSHHLCVQVLNCHLIMNSPSSKAVSYLHQTRTKRNRPLLPSNLIKPSQRTPFANKQLISRKKLLSNWCTGCNVYLLSRQIPGVPRAGHGISRLPIASPISHLSLRCSQFPFFSLPAITTSFHRRSR